MTSTWLQTSGLAELAKRGVALVSALEASFFFRVLQKTRTLISVEKSKALQRMGRLKLALLVLLVISALFIPRIPLGGIFNYYSIDLKLEDLALAGLLFVFFISRAEAVLCPWRHAVETSFLCFLLAAIFSIAAGLGMGTLDKPLMSLLYLVKWVEYFLIFVLTARLSQSVNVSFFMRLFFLTGLALAAYGYYEHFYPVSKAAYPNYYRLFERPPFHGDANHIGGVLAMWLAFFSAAYLRLSLTPALSPEGRGSVDGQPVLGTHKTGSEYGKKDISPSPFGRGQGEGWGHKSSNWILLASILFVFFPFIWTFSRKSYVAFAGAYSVLFFLPGVSRRRWIFLACLLVSGGLLLPTRLAERLSDLGEVLTTVDPYHSSWAGNLDVWKRCFWNFDRFWLFGAGFGARHRLFYESQYIMTLTETGVFGFGAFITLLLVPALCALRRIKDPGSQGLLAGAWFSAWVAFMVHNLSCVSLTVSKSAVVWWFLTGVFIGEAEKRKSA